METDYLLRQFDDQKPTHILLEWNMPAGEIWQARGYVFVPPGFAARLGEPDDTVSFGAMTFPAWRMDGEMPADHSGR